MPARWKVGLALLALSITGRLWAATVAPQAVIARCASQAGALATGIAALEKACPGVEDALTQLQLTALMPQGWRHTLTAHGLSDIDEVLNRYTGPPPSQPPKAAALQSIAAGLEPQQEQPTWRERIDAWVRRRLVQPLYQWLKSLGSSLRSARHPQAIFYGLVALLLVAIAAVLAFELRGTGLTRLRRRALPPRRAQHATDSTEPAPSQPGDPDWTRLREQPARLLRILVATMTRARRLEHDRHLTCRELERQARFDTQSERAGFSQVALLAERELYGPPGVTVLSDETLRDAQALHARLLAASTSRGGVAQ